MKKTILITLLTVALNAPAQIQFINLTALATNITVSSAQITIPGLVTNASYTASNHAAVTIGDNPNTVGSKVNSSFAYISNSLVNLAQIPTQIGSNLVALATGQSNRINAVVGTNAWLASRIDANAAISVTNNGTGYTLGGTFTGDGTGLTLSGTNLASGTVNSNALDTATMALFDRIMADTAGNGGTTLMLQATDTGTPMYLHVNSTGVATWTSSP